MLLDVLWDGNIACVAVPDPRIADLVRKALTYSRVKPLMTRRQRMAANGSSVQIQSIRVYEEVQPGEFYFPAGLVQHLEESLQRSGVQFRLIDTRPASKNFDSLFVPQWDLISEFQLRPGQKEALQQIAQNQRGLVIWPTGAGKSFLIKLICMLFPRINILITTYSQTVLEDRYRDLVAHLPQVSVYHGSRKMPIKRITCCSAGCLPHMDPDRWHLVLVDEYHEMGTDRCIGYLSQFRYSRMFGFSANYRDRVDKADFELEGIFGRPVAISSYEENVASGSIVPIEVRWSVVPDPYDYGDLFGVELQRHAVWRNDIRNRMIARDARRYPDKQVLIVVDTIEHALRLKLLLPEFAVCYAPRELGKERIRKYKALQIWPDNFAPLTPPAAHAMKLEFESRKLLHVIATSVWNRGVNFRHLEVLIRADGSGSPIDSTQIPGRLSRVCDAKELGILHDYIDGFEHRSKVAPCGAKRMYRKSEARYHDYVRQGWAQVIPEGIPFPSRRSDRCHDSASCKQHSG